LASDPALLKRTWATQKAVLTPGTLDTVVKEMIYLAVSITNGCEYGIASHTALARKAGMTDGMFAELDSIAASNSARYATGSWPSRGGEGSMSTMTPSPASRGPPASAIVAANHAACSSGGSPVAKWYAIRTRKPAARMPAQLAANCGSRSPMPSVAFAATSWMLSAPRTALQSTVPSQWET